MAVKYKYKYKPTAASFFKPTTSYQPAGTNRVELMKSLSSQKTNLEARLKSEGVDVDGGGKIDSRNLIEKALNLTPDQNVLMDIIEVLDRPREAVAGIINTLGKEQTEQSNVLKAAWEGLAGKTKISSKEAIENLTGMDLTIDQNHDTNLDEIGRFIVDLGLDLATDPLSYVGGALGKAAGGAVKKSTAKLVTVGNSALKSTNPVAKAFGTGMKALQDLATKAKPLFNALDGLTDDFVRRFNKIVGRSNTEANKILEKATALRKKLASTGFEGAEDVINELMEAGVFLEQGADGIWKVTKIATPKVKAGDLVDNLVRNVENGTSEVILHRRPSAINQTAKKQSAAALGQVNTLANRLNELVPTKSLQRTFQVVQAGDNWALRYNGTLDELKEAVSILKKEHIWGVNINFGKRQLSEKATQFIAQHGDVAKDALKTVNNLNDAARGLLSSYGNFEVDGQTMASGLGYMRHIPTEESLEYLSKKAPAIYGKPNMKNMKYSKFAERQYDVMAKDINAAVESFYGMDGFINESAIDSVVDLVNRAETQFKQQEALQLVLGVQYDKTGKRFVPIQGSKEAPLFTALDVNTREAVQEGMKADMKLLKTNNFKTEFSNISKYAPDEIKKTLDALIKQAGADGKVVGMQQSAYNLLKNIDNAYREVPKFWKIYDRLMGHWKGVSLLSPAFHARNFVGNASNMYLAGMNTMDILKYQGQAWKDLSEYNKLSKIISEGGDAAKALKADPKSAKFINDMEEFFETGLAQSRRGVRDLEETSKMIERAGRKKSGAFRQGYDTLIEKNFRLAEDADVLQRYAMYQWAKDGKNALDGAVKVAKKTPFEAAQTVRNALFDYTNLSPFERDVMKRLVPFYTFMKNNVVFHATNIDKNLPQYAKMFRAYKTAAEDFSGKDANELPDYMTGNMWLPIPVSFNKNDEDAMTFLKLNLPPAEFLEFVENPLKKGVNSITMPIKLLMELGQGKDSFTGAPLKEFAGEKNRMSDEGVMAFLRGEKGDVYLSGDPVIQKIADDIGLRNPRKLVTAIMDVLDTATGKQSIGELGADILDRTGIASTKRMEELELTELYQQLEYLRNLKKLYEQQTGRKLPTQR